MKSQKQSRLDKLEQAVQSMAKHIMDQDQAIRWLINKVDPREEETKLDLSEPKKDDK